MSKDTKANIIAYAIVTVVFLAIAGAMYFLWHKMGCIDGRPLSETPNICLLMR